MPALDAIVEQLLGELARAEVAGVAKYMRAKGDNLPHQLDGQLLARCRAVLGRKLDEASRRYLRTRTRQRIREIAADAV